MKAAVIVFPGSNCDRDCKVAIERSTGGQAIMVWHQETKLADDLDLPERCRSRRRRDLSHLAIGPCGRVETKHMARIG